MKIRLNIIRHAMVMTAVALFAACSDNESWQAGPQIKEGCQQVHFAGSNSTMTALDYDDPDDRTVTLTVVRNTSQGALTVPMSVEKADEGLEIPEEVVFSDGQQETSVDIHVTAQAKKGTSFAYSLKLTGDEIDPYTNFDGGCSFDGTISFPKELTVKMWLVDNNGRTIDAAGYWFENMMEMGSGTYCFKNLMGSGQEVNITIDQNNRLTLSSPMWSEANYTMQPGYYNPTDCYFWCNYWDDNAQDYIYYPFYPHGKDSYMWIEQIEIYTDSDPSNWYSYYYKNTSNEADSYFSLSLANLKLSTERNNRWWQELRFRFLKDGEEPENYLPDQPETPEQGEEVTFTASFGENYDFFGGTFDIKAKKKGDNGYLFEDFLGCGDDITITIDKATGGLTFEGLYSQYWDDLFYLTASDGYGATVYPNKGVTDNYINYMYFYTASGTDYVRWNEGTKTFEIGAYIYVNEDYETAYWDTLYLQLNE